MKVKAFLHCCVLLVGFSLVQGFMDNVDFPFDDSTELEEAIALGQSTISDSECHLELTIGSTYNSLYGSTRISLMTPYPASLQVNNIQVFSSWITELYGHDQEYTVFFVATFTSTCQFLNASKHVIGHDISDFNTVFIEEVQEQLKNTPKGGYVILLTTGNFGDFFEVFEEPTGSGDDRDFSTLRHDMGGASMQIITYTSASGYAGLMRSQNESHSAIGETQTGYTGFSGSSLWQIERRHQASLNLSSTAFVIRKGHPAESFVKHAPYDGTPRFIDLDIDVEGLPCIEPLTPLDPLMFDPYLPHQYSPHPSSTLEASHGPHVNLVYGDPIACSGNIYGWEYIPGEEEGIVYFSIYRSTSSDDDAWEVVQHHQHYIQHDRHYEQHQRHYLQHPFDYITNTSGEIEYMCTTRRDTIVKDRDRYAVQWADPSMHSTYPVRHIHEYGNDGNRANERYPCSRQMLPWEMFTVKTYVSTGPYPTLVSDDLMSEKVMAMGFKPIMDPNFVYKCGCHDDSDCWSKGDIHMTCNISDSEINRCVCMEGYFYNRKSNRCLLDIIHALEPKMVAFQDSILDVESIWDHADSNQPINAVDVRDDFEDQASQLHATCAKTSDPANPWYAVEFAQPMEVHSVSILTPEHLDVYAMIWYGNIPDAVEDFNNPDLVLYNDDVNTDYEPMGPIISLIIMGPEPWMLKNDEGDYMVLNDRMTGNILYTYDGSQGENLGTVGNTGILLYKLRYYGYLMHDDSDGVPMCLQYDDESQRINVIRFELHFATSVLNFTNCTIFYFEPHVSDEYYIRVMEYEGMSLMLDAITNNTEFAIGPDRTTFVLDQSHHPPLPPPISAIDEPELDALFDTLSTYIMPTELNSCLGYRENSNSTEYDARVAVLDTECQRPWYLKKVFNESISRYYYDTDLYEGGDISFAGTNGLFSSRPCMEIVDASLPYIDDRRRRRDNGRPPLGARFSHIHSDDYDFDVFIYDDDFDSLIGGYDVTYRYSRPNMYQFSIWVSNRKPSLRSFYGESHDYQLCTRFEGIAKPGRVMHFDCDEPVTGIYVFLHQDNGGDIRLCDWHIYGYVADATCADVHGHPLISGDLYHIDTSALEIVYGHNNLTNDEEDLRLEGSGGYLFNNTVTEDGFLPGLRVHFEEPYEIYGITTKGESPYFAHQISLHEDDHNNTDIFNSTSNGTGIFLTANMESSSFLYHQLVHPLRALTFAITLRDTTELIGFEVEFYGCPVVSNESVIHGTVCSTDEQCYVGLKHEQLICRPEYNNPLYGGRCGCKDGYQYDVDADLCVDWNECLNVTCLNGTCVNTYGSYYCSCEKGFRFNDEDGCLNIDECYEDLHDCEHICMNFELSTYRCECFEGYIPASLYQENAPNELFPYGVNVGDSIVRYGLDYFIPLHLSTPFVISGKQHWRLSLNSQGNIAFERDYTTCCLRYEFPMPYGALVSVFWGDVNINVHGHVTYRIVHDTDTLNMLSMAIENHRVGNNFQATLGYIATYVDVSEFGGYRDITNTFQVALATDGIKSFAIFNYERIEWIREPYGSSRMEIGVNDGKGAFIKHPFSSSFLAYYLPYVSNVGIDGRFIYATHQFDANDPSTCMDLDECEVYGTQELCARNGEPYFATCVNTPGSYECICRHGFEWNEYSGECRDIQECYEGRHTCQGRCENTVGGYVCHCDDAGFELSVDHHSCIDINECERHSFHCNSSRSNCVNTLGSFHCICDEGYTFYNATSEVCEDVDECSMDNGGCEHICHNNDGSYDCSCYEGFAIGSYDHTCVDIDECENEPCLENTDRCINEPGTFQCVCIDGFILNNDTVSCSDINECEDRNGGCMHDCHNFEGSRNCSCHIAYELLEDGTSCGDVDECIDEDLNTCLAEVETCKNHPGFYTCDCNSGFYRPHPSNAHCRDKNECLDDNGGCQHQCENSYGSFRCECNEGYELMDDGKSCADIDECRINNGLCEQQCINTPGANLCTCHGLYTLDEDRQSCIGEGLLRVRMGLNIQYQEQHGNTNSEEYRLLKQSIDAGLMNQVCSQDQFQNNGVRECSVVGPFSRGSIIFDFLVVTNDFLTSAQQDELGMMIVRELQGNTTLRVDGTEVSISRPAHVVFNFMDGHSIPAEELCILYTNAMFCLNGGVCQLDNYVPICRCDPEFTGVRCDFRIEPEVEVADSEEDEEDDDVLSTIQFVLVAILGVIALIVFGLIVALCWLITKPPKRTSRVDPSRDRIRGPAYGTWWTSPPSYVRA